MNENLYSFLKKLFPKKKNENFFGVGEKSAHHWIAGSSLNDWLAMLVN